MSTTAAIIGGIVFLVLAIGYPFVVWKLIEQDYAEFKKRNKL